MELLGGRSKDSSIKETNDYEMVEPMMLLTFEDLLQLGKFEPFSYLDEQEYLVDYQSIVREKALIVYIAHNWLVEDGEAIVDNRDREKFETVVTAIDTFLEYTKIPSAVQVFVWIDYCCIEIAIPEKRKRRALSVPAYISNSDLLLTPILSNRNFSRNEMKALRKEAASHKDVYMQTKRFDYQLLDDNVIVRTEKQRVLSDFAQFLLFFSRAWTRLELSISLWAPVQRVSKAYDKMEKIRRLNAERPHIFGLLENHKPKLYFLPEFSRDLVKSLRNLDECEASTVEDKSTIKEVLAIALHEKDIERDIYDGELDENNKAHGFGMMKYTNGETYEGNWVHGVKEGKGKYTYANGGQYDGEWRLGQKHGKGRLVYANGDVYEGEFAEGFMQGEGKMKFAKGGEFDGAFFQNKFDGFGKLILHHITYEGQFKKGKMEGKGRYRDELSGLEYIGEFMADQFHGRGKLERGEERYDGHFSFGKKHGTGVYYYDDDSKYNGYWKNNMKHGKGQYFYASGNYYEGDFKKDIKDGNGVFLYNNGDRYEGQFKHDVFHGEGIFEYAKDGSLYKGSWHRGKIEGKGAFYYGNTGDVYRGKWKNGKKHGVGDYWLPNSISLELRNIKKTKEHYHGEFKNDKKHGEGIYKFKNGNKYQGHWENDQMSGYGIMDYPSQERYEGSFLRGKRHGAGKLIRGDLEVAGEWFEDVQLDEVQHK